MIEEGARKGALGPEGCLPYDPGKPAEIKVEYTSTDPPQKLRFQTGVELLDACTLVSRADDWWTA